ncbi:hypothetical protein [Picosynechococcus sp. PCC 7003]|uniref:hypothetical protein n=1 Tax=Picosynechococcus sp. PCC 7003 TaxID=374981 RepID=UPI0012EE4870|nr:hypothetical protein [Picosynechococcus sp. PCC 7003]
MSFHLFNLSTPPVESPQNGDLGAFCPPSPPNWGELCPLAPKMGEPEKYRRAIADLSTPPVESPQNGDLGSLCPPSPQIGENRRNTEERSPIYPPH